VQQEANGGPVQRAFEADAASVSEARRFVLSTVSGWGVDQEAAGLLTTELAANAVRHARSAFCVEITRDDGTIRVGIVNDEPDMLLIVKEPDDDGGRGLHILESLAQGWGVENRPETKVVWFELPAETQP
jgi:anti-sigma regulatory factor (Ser/Thr protein kinase)